MTTGTFDVVVVNWNSGNDLAACLRSIVSHANGYVGRIVVVDNASVDRSVETVRGIAGIDVIAESVNHGFGRACNIGARDCRADYLLFLNPDARVPARAFEQIDEFLSRPHNSKIGICGIRLMDEAGHVARSCSRFPSALRILAHAIGADKIVPRWGQRMNEWDHLSTRTVDQIIGAFFVIRRSLYEKLGGFDEQFFVYFEEVDLSYRAVREGWSSVYLAEIAGVHSGGGSSKRIKARRLFYSLRSRIIYARKHFSRAAFCFVLVATLALEPFARIVVAACRFSLNSVWETMCAYGMTVRWFISGGCAR